MQDIRTENAQEAQLFLLTLAHKLSQQAHFLKVLAQAVNVL